MSSNDDWLFDPKSNRLIKTYLRGYLDISGGDIILRNNNIFVRDGDISLNGKLFVTNDASFNSKMFIAKDVCMNQLLLLGNDASFNSKLFVANDVCMNQLLLLGNDASFNSKLFVASDVCMNELLIVGNDASFNSKLFVADDVSFNETLHVGNDSIFDSKLYAVGDVSFDSLLAVHGDVSLNSNLYVVKDVSFDSILTVHGDVSLNSELYVADAVLFDSTLTVSGDTVLNSELHVVKDVSFDSLLAVNKDVSFNSNLYVAGDVLFDSTLTVSGDVSFNSKLSVQNDASFNSNVDISGDLVIRGTLGVYQYQDVKVINTTVNNYELIISEDISLNGRLFASDDVSLNSKLFVADDVSFDSVLMVNDDVSFNSNLFVNGDVSFNNNLDVGKDIRLRDLYTRGKAEIVSTLDVSGGVVFGSTLDVSNNTILKSKLHVVKDASFDSILVVNGDVSFNSNQYVNKNVYIKNDLFVNRDVSMNSTLTVSGDVSMNSHVYAESLTVSGDAIVDSKLSVNHGINVKNGYITANNIISNVQNLPLDVTSNFNSNRYIIYSQYQNMERVYNGVYDVSASSFTTDYEPWKVFTDHTGTLSSANWRSSPSYTNGIPNTNTSVTTYTNLSNTSTNVLGEYIDITLPFYIRIQHISITCNNYDEASTPGIIKFVTLGEINGSWTELTTYNGTDATSIQLSPTIFDIPTNTLYTNKFRIVINQIRNSTNYAVISYLAFGGDVMGSKINIDDGNIGIGNTNPRSALEVTGDIVVSNAASGLNSKGTDIEHGRIVWSGIQNDISNSSTYIRSYFENNTYDTSGNLAFGTNNGYDGAIDRFVIHATGENEFMSDVSINTRLMVNSDVSFNSNLYVEKDVSFNSNLYVANDVSFNSNLYVAKELTVSTLTVSGDVSLKSNLYVEKDVSFNSNLYVANDVSFNSNLYVEKELTVSTLTVSGDVSFNSNLYVANDVSFNSNLYVEKDVSFNSNLYVAKDVSFNSNLYVAKDVSFNSNLYVAKDVSFNSNLYVENNVGVASNLYVSGGVLSDSYLDVFGDVSFHSNLDVQHRINTNDLSTNYLTSKKLFVGNDNVNEEVVRVFGKIAAYEFLNLSSQDQGAIQLVDSYVTSVIFGDADQNPPQIRRSSDDNRDLMLVTGNEPRILIDVCGQSIFYDDVSMNSNLEVDGNVHMKSNLIVNNDVSLNSKLFVADDVSFNSDITVSGDVYMKSNLIVNNDVSFNSDMTVSGDVSFNSNLTVTGDVSFNSKLNVDNDVSLNSNLTVSGDVYMNSNLIVNNDISVNSNLFVADDVSFNSNLFVNMDALFNSNITVSGDISFNSNLTVSGDVYMYSNLIVNNDINVNSNMFVADDVLFNSKLTVSKDVYINSNLIVNNDVSLNSKLFVVDDVSFNSKLFVADDVSFNSKLFIVDDVSFNSKLFVADDVSFNSKLFVADDVSFNGDTYIKSNLIVNNDVSLNSNLFVADDVSFNSNLTVSGDTYMKSKLIVNNDVSLNSKLFVIDDVSFNSNLTVSGDVIIFGKLDVNQIRNTNTVNTTVNEYTLMVSEDLSLNGSLSVQGDLSLNGNANISNQITVQKDGDVIIKNKNIIIGDTVYLSTIVASSIFSIISNPALTITKTFLSNNDFYTITSSSYNTISSYYSVASAFVNNLSSWKSSVRTDDTGQTYRTLTSDGKQLIFNGTFSTSYYNPINNSSVTLTGEWIQLELPYNAIVDSYELRTETYQVPTYGVLLGWDYTQNRWQLIHIYDKLLVSLVTDQLFQFTTMSSILETNKYRFVVNQIYADSNTKLTTAPDLDGNVSTIYDHNVSIRYINFSGNIKNTGISVGAGYSQNTANTSMGFGTLAGNVTGKNNIAIGNYTLSQSKTSDNIAIGYNALVNNQQGTQNIVIGTDTQVNNTAGNENVTLGHQSGYFNTGSGNTYVGYQSGYYNRDGSYNTYVGYNTGGSSNTNFSNSTAIGANATITANNQIVIGTSTNTVKIPGALQLQGAFSGDVSFNDKLFVNKAVQLNSTLRVAKSASLAALDVSGNLNIQNQLLATNTTTSVQELIVKGSAFLQSTTASFTVNGPSNIVNTLNVTKGTTLKSTLNVSKASTLKSTLNVSKAATMGSRLNVTGDVSLNSKLTVQNNVNMSQNLTVAGSTQLNTLNTSGNTAISGTFTTRDSVTFASNDSVSAKDKFNITTGPNSSKTTSIRNETIQFYDDEGTSPFIEITDKKMYINQGGNSSNVVLDVTGIIEASTVTLKAGGTVQSTGDTAQVSSSIIVGDASDGIILEPLGTTPSPYGLIITTQRDAVVDNDSAITIDASGNMTLSRSLQIDSSLNVLNGNAKIKYLDIINDTSLNTLYVAGNTSLDSTIDVSGATTMKSTLSVSKAATMKSTLSVSNAATLNSTLNVADVTTLESTLDVSGATTLKDTLNVTNQTSLHSHLDVSGNITCINGEFRVNKHLTDITNIPQSITGDFNGDNVNIYSQYYGSERVFNNSYDISASSFQTDHSAWNVFNSTDNAWYSANYYSNTVPIITAAAQTTFYDSSDISFSRLGEYIDIRFPFNIKLTTMNIRCDDFSGSINSSISQFTILYKTDDDKWKIYYQYTDSNPQIAHSSVEDADTVINISDTGLYSNYYRIVITQIGSGTNYAVVSKLSFDGDIIGSNIYIHDGNMGIGNSLPRSALEVTGNILLSNTTDGVNNTGADIEHGRIVWGGINRDISHNNHSSYIRSYFKDGTYDTSGNLAFGTSNGSDVAIDKFIIHSNGVSEFMTDVSINANLAIAENLNVNTLSIDNNLLVNGQIGVNTSSPNVVFDISATDAIRIPVGSTSQRPTSLVGETNYYGSVRYNTTNSQFEGYGPGGAWGSLGGVINVAQNTKILAAEPNPDSSNNQLTFYTNGARRMIVDSTGDVSMGYKLLVSGKTTLQNDVSMNADVDISGDLVIKGNLSVFQTKQTETINTTVNDYTIIVTEDISLNGTLISSKDISVNSLTVGKGSGNVSTNSAFGVDALYSNTTTGTNNVAFGYRALYSNTTGDYNTAVGYLAGDSNISGSYNTLIGSNTDVNSNWQYSTALGYGALITTSNQIVLGRSSELVKIPGNCEATSYNATSDYRIKKDVIPIADTSYNIDKLRPITYTNTISNKQDIGLLAHEVQQEYPFLVTGEKDGEHHQTVNYTGLIGVLIHEIQQLKKRVNELEQSNP